VLLSGAMQGAFPLPMKYTKKWKWENTWSVFAFWGFVVLPWLLAFLTVPNLMDVYTSASWKTLAAVTFFGAGWGIGTICFGIGISMVGLAVAFAVVIGMASALGTLIPMLVFHPEAFWTLGGLTISGAVLLMLIGVGLCALAGSGKERAQSTTDNAEDKCLRAESFNKGLIVCIISGIASPMLNFAFVFGDELIAYSKTAGASPAHASNPIWCWAMTSAFVVTLIYCLHLMRKDRGWSRYALQETGCYWGLSLSMGILWSGSIAVYGIGLSMLGPLASSIGWPILMISSIVVGNLCGLVAGEWKGAGIKPLIMMVGGIVVLIMAICLIAIGNG
jgi:L-rhamnose-H+ transport protein